MIKASAPLCRDGSHCSPKIRRTGPFQAGDVAGRTGGGRDPGGGPTDRRVRAVATRSADAYLVEAVRSGDEAAWRDLIARYQGRLLSFARRMLAQPADAEDLVQETFLGLLRSLASYDSSRSLETYLFAILRNKLRDQFRAADGLVRQSLDQLDLDESPQAWVETETPSRHASAAENVSVQREVLVECLRRWVEGCRARRRFEDLMVVEMLLVLGLRNKEVAADLELSETAVAGIKFRVLRQWRSLVRKRQGGFDWCEGDLARDSTLGRIWREEGISCLKRSTLGRYLLGALDDHWNLYIDFHVNQLGCPRCAANLDDLRAEGGDEQQRRRLQQRCFASSVGFLSRRPAQG
jgi:RNA polymerase sigma-70 factor (ECF subfamily)